MKKSLQLMLMSMMLFAGQVFAEEVTINFDNDYATLFPTLAGTSSNDSHDGDFTTTTTSTPVGGVTVTVSPVEDAKTPSRIWNKSPMLRMYSGTFTVTGTDITKIVFNTGSNFNLTTEAGTLEGKTWTGSKTPEVVFAVGGNTQIKSITVTLGEGGDTPGPVNPGDVTKAASIADLIAMGDKENVELTLNNAKVVFNDGNSIYLRENGKALCFYGIDAVKSLFKDNALVSGTIIVDYLLYQSLLPEVKANDNTSAAALSVTESEEPAAPVETTLARVAAGEHFADLVTVTAKLVREVTETTKADGTTSTTTNYFLEDEGVRVKVANNGKNLKDLADAAVETVIATGIVNTYSSACQIKLTKKASDPNNPEGPDDPEPQPGELSGEGTLQNPYTAADAVIVAGKLENGAVTTEKYYIKGIISSIKNEFDVQHGTAIFFISNDGTEENAFQVYSAYYLNNRAWVEGDTQIKVGDEVIVCGQLTNYNGTPETASKKSYIYSLNGVTDGGISTEPVKVGSIAELLKMENTNNVELTLTNAKVLFNDGNYIYLRENGYAICFYQMDAVKALFKDNALVSGTIRADYEVYRLMPELKANGNTSAETLSVTESEEETVPTQTNLTNVDNGDNVCDLITLTAKLDRRVKYKTDENGQTVISEETGEPVVSSTEYYLLDEEAEVKVANNGKNLKELADAGVELVTVTGIVNTYNSAYQVKLTKDAVNADEQQVVNGDVNGDGAVNVADISAIISQMAGTDSYERADVNGDGAVNVADISAVITIMAGGTE